MVHAASSVARAASLRGDSARRRNGNHGEGDGEEEEGGGGALRVSFGGGRRPPARPSTASSLRPGQQGSQKARPSTASAVRPSSATYQQPQQHRPPVVTLRKRPVSAITLLRPEEKLDRDVGYPSDRPPLSRPSTSSSRPRPRSPKDLLKEGSYTAPRSRGTAFDALNAKLIDHGHTHKVFAEASRPPSAASLRPRSATGGGKARPWPDFREAAWTRERRDALFRAAYCQAPRRTIYVREGRRGRKEFAAYAADESGMARHKAQMLGESVRPPAQHVEGFDEWLGSLERALEREVEQSKVSRERPPSAPPPREDRTLRGMYEDRREAAQRSEREMKKNLKGTHRWMQSQEEGFDLMNPFVPDDLKDSDDEGSGAGSGSGGSDDDGEEA